MMDAQGIILVLIVASAALYIGSMLWKKIRSFSGKKGCDTDCGCSAGSKKSSL